MPHEIDNDSVYYFIKPHADRYYTLFIGWMAPELKDALINLKDGAVAQVRLNVGENAFCASFDGPVYLLNTEQQEALAYAGDDDKLELFPSGNGPELGDVPSIIAYPTYWLKGIEPMLEWKFDCNLFHQSNGVWVPTTIKQ